MDERGSYAPSDEQNRVFKGKTDLGEPAYIKATSNTPGAMGAVPIDEDLRPVRPHTRTQPVRGGPVRTHPR